MGKRILLSGLAIFVAWSALDFVIHGLILRSAYEATASLWRPMGEMKMGLMYSVVFISSFIFVFIYAWLVGEKSICRGIQFGLLYGIGIGIGMGYGSYSFMPIPYKMALTWFLGTTAEGIVGGCLAGLIIRK